MLFSRSLPALRTLPRRTFRGSKTINGVRTYADTHGSGGHGTHGNSVDEAIPTWLYLSLAGGFGLFIFTKFVHPSEDNFISRFLAERESKKAEDIDRTSRHTALIEQAARDKALFLNSEGSPTIPLRFQERFNVHSPMNNVAGWSRGRALDEVKAFYEAENQKMDEENALRWEKVRQQHLNDTETKE